MRYIIAAILLSTLLSCAVLKPEKPRESYLVGDALEYDANGDSVTERGVVFLKRTHSKDMSIITEKGIELSGTPGVEPYQYEARLTRLPQSEVYEIVEKSGDFKGQVTFTDKANNIWVGEIQYKDGRRMNYTGQGQGQRETKERKTFSKTNELNTVGKDKLWLVTAKQYQALWQEVSAANTKQTHYYVGESVAKDARSKQVIHKARTFVKRVHLPNEDQILESVHVVDLARGMTNDYSAVIQCRTRSRVCDVKNSEGKGFGTITYLDKTRKKWSYQLKVPSAISGRGWLSEAGLKAERKINMPTGKRSILVYDDLQEVGEMEYQFGLIPVSAIKE